MYPYVEIDKNEILEILGYKNFIILISIDQNIVIRQVIVCVQGCFHSYTTGKTPFFSIYMKFYAYLFVLTFIFYYFYSIYNIINS